MVEMKNSSAYSLIEVVIVMSLLSILCGLATLNYTELQNPADNASRAMLAYFKAVQGKAMATTSTYTLSPLGNAAIRATFSTSCSSVTQNEDLSLRFKLPDGALLGNLSWQVCYNSRGLANNSVDIPVNDSRVSRTLRVTLGGGLKLE